MVLRGLTNKEQRQDVQLSDYNSAVNEYYVYLRSNIRQTPTPLIQQPSLARLLDEEYGTETEVADLERARSVK